MAYTFNTELKNVLYTYIQLTNIKLPKKRVKDQIEESPYFPSLLSISELFNSYSIQNSAYKIPRENFMELADEVPFIAFVKTDESNMDFVAVSNIDNEKVSFYHEGSRVKTMDAGTFKERFKEVVWKSSNEVSQSKIQTYIDQEKRHEYFTLTAILILIASVASFIHLERLSSVFELRSLYIINKLIGLSITCLLVAYELDKNNSFVKNLCTINSKTNCDAVLNSSASKIFGFSWAEIGVSYFLSTTLILVNPSLSIETRLTVTTLLSFLASCYIIFSLYYQWRVVKQWCVLCLFTQLILFLELGLAISYVGHNTLLLDTSFGTFTHPPSTSMVTNYLKITK